MLHLRWIFGTLCLSTALFLSACGDSAVPVDEACQRDSECDDSNACTVDVCGDDGRCSYEPLDVATACDDGNPCTADSCDPASGCVHDGTDVTGDCDDGDECTADDVCQGDAEGTCLGRAMTAEDCDDGNPCTVDVCLKGQGCTHDGYAVTDACDDGNVCTIDDRCAGDIAGTCVGTDISADCDDGNPCTADSCDPLLGCLNDGTGVQIACDDGDPCTSGEVCSGDEAGTCGGGTPTVCDDHNPCTLDACEPGVGCVFDGTGVVAECDDHNVCTTGDVCLGDAAGTCAGAFGPAADCDDGNICTVDTCDARLGCVHDGTGIVSACDDSDACTVGEVCLGDAEGTCGGGSSVVCDDGNPCTADSCDPATGCVFDGTGIVTGCDDGNVCTDDDLCAGDAAGTCLGTDISATLCDDGNACTVDSCHPIRGCRNDLLADQSCYPHFTITFPPRGATIQGSLADPVVTVSGTVISGAGPIESLSINGEAVTVAADGSFAYPMDARVGGNVIVAEATDSMGSLRKRVQAFLFSDAYVKPDPASLPPDMVEQGMAIWLSQEVLDDGDHSLPPDDLATIFELVLAGIDLSSFIDTSAPLANEASYDIYLTSLTRQSSYANLTAINGGLRLNAGFVGIHGDLYFDCTCSGIFCACTYTGGDSEGDLTIDSLAISADVLLSVAPDHSLVVSVVNPQTTISGLEISADSGWLDFLLGLVAGAILDGVVADLEAELNTQLTTEIAPLLQDALSALAFNEAFDLPRLDGSGDMIPVQLMTDFQFTDFTPAGGALGLRSTGLTAGPAPYDNLGFPLRQGCGSSLQTLVVPASDPFELVLSDDTLNALFHAAWYGGMLEFPIPESMLGDLDLAAYGIENLQLAISGMLAPTAGDCYADGALRIFLGDMRLDASFDFGGMPVGIVLWATASMGLELQVGEGEISIVLTGFDSIDTELTVVQDNLVGLIDLIGDGFEVLLTEALMTALNGGQLASIPLPAIDLSGMVEGIPPGTVLALDPQHLTRIDGNTIIGGALLQ